MTALLNIHLDDGLTADEISALAQLGRLDGQSVETEIMEALRAHVRRHRRRVVAPEPAPGEAPAA